ncbi:DNA repair protein RecO [bacterium]|nr:DNA repair protein RecO [bacterium]
MRVDSLFEYNDFFGCRELCRSLTNEKVEILPESKEIAEAREEIYRLAGSIAAGSCVILLMIKSKYKRMEGIVLRRIPLGETDQIYTIFTPEYGRIRASARGALRPKNKWRGVLEPFHQIEAELYMSSRSNLHRFSRAEVLSRPSGFLKHLTALYTAYVVLECLERFTPDETPNQDIYYEVLRTFGYINRKPDEAGFAVRCFCLRFFSLSGFGIEWNQCVRCRRQRPVDRSAYCIPAEGGIVCKSCIETNLAQPERIIHGSTIKFAVAAADGVDVENVETITGDVQMFNTEIQRMIQETFAHHLGEIPKSMAMMV